MRRRAQAGERDSGIRAPCRGSCRRWSPARLPAIAGAIDVGGGVDQADVAERLREVAELLAARGVDLLGEQAQIIGVTGQTVEQRRGALGLARLGKAGDEPEAADDERALLALEAVRVGALCVSIAQHEAVLGQVALDQPRSSRACARRSLAESRKEASAAPRRRVRRSRTTARRRRASRSSRVRAPRRGSRRARRPTCRGARTRPSPARACRPGRAPSSTGPSRRHGAGARRASPRSRRRARATAPGPALARSAAKRWISGWSSPSRSR